MKTRTKRTTRTIPATNHRRTGRHTILAATLAALTAFTVAACKRAPEPTPDPSRATRLATGGASGQPDPPVVIPAPSGISPSGLVELIPAPPGDVKVVVRAVLKAAKKEDRRVVVYDSSPRSEPCVRFRESAVRGDLDSTLNKVLILEFDYDRDGERLEAAGYPFKVIPSFTIPQLDGQASRFVFEGSTHAPALTAFLGMKLQGLLMQSRSGL